jgi:hypothetical protein
MNSTLENTVFTWICTLDDSTDLKDDDLFLMQTATEAKDIVLKLFNAIPHFIVFMNDRKNETLNGFQNPISPKTIEEYSVFNAVTGKLFGTLGKMVKDVNDKKITEWIVTIVANPLGQQLINILTDKYPESKCSVSKICRIMDRHAMDSSIFTITPKDTTSKTVSQCLQEILTIAEYANCFYLMSKPEKNIEDGMSTVKTKYIVYNKIDENDPEVLHITAYSKGKVTENGSLESNPQEYLEIKPVCVDRNNCDKFEFTIRLYHSILEKYKNSSELIITEKH